MGNSVVLSNYNSTLILNDRGDILSSSENAKKAQIWAEGTDAEVESIGGEHSAKTWAETAGTYASDPNVVACGENISSITSVASDLTNINAVIGISSDINSVAGISTEVSTVANNASAVSTCSANIEDIKVAPAAAESSLSNATSASSSASNAQKWAEGADSAVTPMGGTHSAKGWAEQAQSIVSTLGTVLHYKGSVANYTALQAVTGQIVGDVYNLLDTGDNYAWDGAAWDKLSGTVDLSAYRTSAAQDIIDSGKQDALVSGTNIKTVNNTSLLGSGNITIDSLPSQTGNSGKFLTTDGSSASWATVSTYPTLTWYTGNTGTSVTIASTASANLVKIYKNGILLEHTADYSISGTTLTLVTALVSTDKITTEVY